MRRPTSALAKAFLGTALAATTVSVSAQQSPPPPEAGSGPASAAPVNSARGVRHLLRNGWDYITYQEYERALGFFREAESRQAELNDAERVRLKQGIERAQRGLREAASGSTTGTAYARTSRPRPGALALGTPPTAPAPALATAARPRDQREPVRLAGATPAAESRGAVAAAPPLTTPASLPPTPDVESDLAAAGRPLPSAAPTDPATIKAQASAPAPAPAAAAAPDPAAATPAVENVPAPELPPPPHDLPLPELPDDPGKLPEPSGPTPEPAPAAERPQPPATLPTPAAVGLDPAPPPMRVAERVQTPAAAPAPEPESLPSLPERLGTGPAADAPPAPPAESIPLPVPTPSPAPAAEPPPVVEVLPEPAPVGAPGDVAPTDTPPAPMNVTAPPTVAPAPARSRGRFGIDTLIPERSDKPHVSTLTPVLQREVEMTAQRQEEKFRQQKADAAPGADAPVVQGGSASTRLEISRAPSPTEARPIRPIPVPEEFVALPKREWQPNRKYWSAAATCHLPLYFQDASLERYGYSMEQRFGPAGRFLSYPLDDPKQSKQRNQLIQPAFSAGLFAAQIALLPYNLIMDPPWEAEYDLGYYRPGDRVPTDVYYLPFFGVGPPLRGKNYGVAPQGEASPPSSRWGS